MNLQAHRVSALKAETPRLVRAEAILKLKELW
jgi:hypothetical protein